MRLLLIALVKALRENQVCIDRLSQYGGQPAVFSSFPAPTDAKEPYALLTLTEDDDYGTISGKFREYAFDVDIYEKNLGSSEIVDAVGKAIKTLLHKQPGAITVTGYTVYSIQVSGPTNTDDAESLGRTLTVRILLYEG